MISLTCALLATLLQQWARRYLRVTQPRYSLHKRARIRSFFAEGVDEFLLPWVVEVLPTLLHVSLFLFFAGLVVFLWNVNLTIFKVVLLWAGVCTAIYGCFTFIPVYRHNSPYYTPLTSLVWPIVIAIPYIIFKILRWFTYSVYFHREASHYFETLKNSYRKMLLQGMLKTVEETALNSPPEIDTRAFLWTFDALDEDHELDHFFSSLSGFRSSKVVDDPLPHLTKEQKSNISAALIGLLDRTFSSDLLPQSVKNRRAILFANTHDPANITDASLHILQRIVSQGQERRLKAEELSHVVRDTTNGLEEDTIYLLQAMVTGLVITAQHRDNSWFTLASSVLGVSETVLRDYAAQGDSLSFAILIHITRQQFHDFRYLPWPGFEFSDYLVKASKFNVQDTSPELQHDFCALWNEIILGERDPQYMAYDTLGPIRSIYLALHQDIDSAPTRFSHSTTDHGHFLRDPSLYPLCNDPSHHPDSTPHIRDETASIAAAPAILLDNAALIPTSLASPGVPSSSTPAPLHVSESLTDVLPLEHDIFVQGSFHSTHHTPVESLCATATSPDLLPARSILGGIDTTTTIPSSPQPSASTSPTSIASISPPGIAADLHIADNHVPLDALYVPSQPLPTTVVVHTSPRSSLNPLMTGSNRLYSPDSPSSLLAPTSHSESQKERDTLDPPSSTTIAGPDQPSMSPSPSLVTQNAVAGPSWRSLDAEHTGDRSAHPSRGQYDIV